MKLGQAIVFTLALLVLSLILSVFIQFPLTLLLVPATAVWAASDVSRLRRRYIANSSFTPNQDVLAMLRTSKPIIVFAACFLLWIFGFPWYLVMRGRLVANAPILTKEADNVAT
jgi:hypothetical protein